MRIAHGFLAWLFLAALLSACSGKPSGSEFVGGWEPVKSGSGPSFQISRDGDAFLLVDNTNAKVAATYDGQAHVLNVSMGPMGKVPFSYIASTDHLSAMGDEFKRAKQDGPATAASTAKTPSLADQAIAFGKNLYTKRMTVCDGRTLTNLSTSGPRKHLAELKTPNFSSDGNDANAGDKLNGVDYRGTIRMTWDAYRVLDKGKWTEWFGAGDGRYDLDIQGFEMIFVVHKQGQWQRETLAGVTDFLSGSAKPLTCEAIPMG